MLPNSDIASYLKHNKEQELPKLKNVDFLPSYVQKLIALYASQPYVKTVMTVGSLSSNTNDTSSDIDLVIVCDDNGIPRKDQRLSIINYISNNKAVIASVDLKTWNFGTADDFAIDNQEICTQFFTINYIEEKIELTISGFYNQVGMEHPLAALSSLIKATVHIDKDNTYKQIVDKIDPYPMQLQKIILDNELGMRLPYYLDRLETAIARGDIPFADKMIHQSIDSAIYILFAYFQRFPNGPKRLFKQLDDIKDEPAIPEIKQCFITLYKTGTTVATLPQKIITLQNVFTLLQGMKRV